jgi:hypothetical protein
MWWSRLSSKKNITSSVLQKVISNSIPVPSKLNSLINSLLLCIWVRVGSWPLSTVHVTVVTGRGWQWIHDLNDSSKNIKVLNKI